MSEFPEFVILKQSLADNWPFSDISPAELSEVCYNHIRSEWCHQVRDTVVQRLAVRVRSREAPPSRTAVMLAVRDLGPAWDDEGPQLVCDVLAALDVRV